MEPFQRSDILLASCVRDLFGRRRIFSYIRRIVRRYIEVPDGAPVFFDKLVTVIVISRQQIVTRQ